MKDFEVYINKDVSDEEAQDIILNLKVGQYVVLETGYSRITKVPSGWVLSVYDMTSIMINESDIRDLG